MPPVPRTLTSTRRAGTAAQRKALTEAQRKEVRAIIGRQYRYKADIKRFTESTTAALVCGEAYVFNPLCQIPTGSTETSRVANHISLKSLDLNVILQNTTGSGASNLRYQVLVWWSDEETANTSVFSTVLAGSVTTVLPLTGSNVSGFAASHAWEYSRCSPVRMYRGTLDQKINTIANEVSLTASIKLYNKRVQYLNDTTGSFLQGKNLYVAFLGDVNAGTPGATTAGNVSVTYQVNFYE